MVLPVPNQATFVAGVTDSAAFLNANVRDSVTFLANPPHLMCVQTAAQSIPNAAFTALTFDTNTVDSYSGHSTVTNTSRYVAQVAGWYWVAGVYATTNIGSALDFGPQIRKNGTAVQGLTVAAASAGTNQGLQVAGPVFLLIGDYVEIYAFQSSGAAHNTATFADLTSSLSVHWYHA